jgi:hypothetical protein
MYGQKWDFIMSSRTVPTIFQEKEGRSISTLNLQSDVTLFT